MIEIRRLIREDIPFIAEIERLCFEDPWSERSLELLLEEKNAGFVAEIDGFVAAYGGILTVLDEGQITNIATHPDYRRRGLAKAIMSAIDVFSSENGIFYLSLEVREKNEAARLLYKSCGWHEVGVRKNFYSKPSDNAVIMIKDFMKGN
jgi:ribosomal-protein-alanine N-acetyltransferase